MIPLLRSTSTLPFCVARVSCAWAYSFTVCFSFPSSKREMIKSYFIELPWHIHLWSIWRVKHLVKLLVLPKLEQNEWLKGDSLVLSHKSQRPKRNFILYFTESLQVCIPRFNLPKKIKSYCYINTNTRLPGIQQLAHITLPHTGFYLKG